MKEADTKRTIADYLETGMAQGKWYYDRLNSGEVIIVSGESLGYRRRVKLCRAGTADFFVLISKRGECPECHEYEWLLDGMSNLFLPATFPSADTVS